MSKNKKVEKEQLWLITYIVIPVVLLMNLGEYFTESSGMKVLYGGLFGALGGGIGAILYFAVKSKSTIIKGVVLTLFFIISIVAVRSIHNNFGVQKLNVEILTELETCAVCGYKSLTTEDKFCGECLVELTMEEMKKDGYSSMKEFLKVEQLIFFSPDSLVEHINFYEPKVSTDGYEKDFNWKPIVSEDSVLSSYLEYKGYLEEAVK